MAVRIYSREEVESHRTARSVWIVLNGKVYDVTEFVNDHPGGPDIILQSAGTDVGSAMSDELIHSHSSAAYEMMEDFCIGELRPDEGVDVKVPVAPSAVTFGTGAKKPFLDLTKPLLAQVFFGNFSKDFYMEQVHIPRQVKGSARLFSYAFLEPLSLTPWWVIPTVYIPICTYLCYLSLSAGSGAVEVASSFTVGIFIWTLIEYTLHRFLFHVDEYLPDNRFLITAHFLLHGIHHFLPMDKMRLVMPPVLGLVLASPIVKLLLTVIPSPYSYAVTAGAFFGFQGYDMIHYSLHHVRPATQHLREMKSYHLDHHYKNAHQGYGITSKMWDYVFGTVLK
ncbi:hypothetical protein DFJ73DRAFT_832438 [Zopfochytrium polystomum]|nr:hypothetical protein DFJ73DRAFT_832438 [Zopfochytrium polystomum]